MVCEQLKDRLPDYWSGDLTEDDRRKVEAHLASCASCRLSANDLGETWLALASIGDEAPSSSMRIRFGQMLEAFQAGVEQGEHRPRTSREVIWWRGWRNPPIGRLVRQAMFVTALLAGGFFIGYARRPAESPSDAIGVLRDEVHDLRRTLVLSLLEQQSATERLRAFNWTARVDQPNEEILNALLSALHHDPNINVRLRAVEALGGLVQNTLVRQGLIDAASQEESPLVQIALIDLFIELPEQQATVGLRRLLQKRTLYEGVRQRAEQGIHQVSGR
jgi:hypothetical protein